MEGKLPPSTTELSAKGAEHRTADDGASGELGQRALSHTFDPDWGPALHRVYSDRPAEAPLPEDN